MKQKTGRKLLGVLLTLALLVGLVPGMNPAALADDSYKNYKNKKTKPVYFDDKSWYVIDYDDSTVTLLAEDCVGKSGFNDYNDGNNYSGSAVEKVVNAYYANSISSRAKAAVNGNKMFLITWDQAKTIRDTFEWPADDPDNVLQCSEYWWTCTPFATNHVGVVSKHGLTSVNNGMGERVDTELGVRPALKLNLKSVTFNDSSKTFEVSQEQGFEIVANGATFTVTSKDGAGWTTTLTIVAPTLTTYGDTGKSEKATLATPTGLSDFNTIAGANVTETGIHYFKATKSGTDYIEGEQLDAAPIEPGDYLAKAFLYDDTNSPSVSVGYTIDKATIQNVSVRQNGTLNYTGEEQTPEVTAVGTAVNDQPVSFTYSKTQDGPYGDMPTVTNVTDGGTFYYKATAPYHKDATGSFNVTVNKVNVTAPTTIASKSYNAQVQTADVDVDENSLYTIENEGGTDAGNYNVVLTLKDAVNYKWSDINNAATESAPKTLTFQITKATTNTVTVSMADWIYGGTRAEPESTATFGTVAYTYSDAENGTFTDTPPTTAGIWYVRAEVAGTDNFVGGSDVKSYTIRKADISPTVSLNDWTYGQAENAPNVEGNFGAGVVSYTYAAKGSDAFAATVPTNAGEYTVKATIPETANYNGGTATNDFTIAKATVTVPDIASGFYTGEKQTPTVTTSEHYSVALNMGGTDVGEYPVVLALKDPINYKWPDNDDPSKTLWFQITQASAPTVTVPTPEAVTYNPDRTLANAPLPEGWAWTDNTIVPTVVNNGYPAALTVDDDNYDYTGVTGYDATTHKVTRTVALTVYKAAQELVMGPMAKTPTYTGSAQELVSAGSAPDGEMQYALGTETKATQPYTTSIPTATDIGTYYVWYRVVGDDNHESTDELGPVEVALAPSPEFGEPDFILPEQLKVLDESAFEGVPSLTIVDAHNCTSIGKDAFKGTGLKQIRLPKDCEIDPEAFGEQRICVFAPAGGTTEAFCAGHDNLVFIAEAE